MTSIRNGIKVKVGFSRRVAGIASIGAMALVLAACNGDTGNDDNNGADPGNGAATEDDGADQNGADDNSTGNNPEGNGELSSLSGNLTGSGASSFQLAIQEWVIEFPELTDGANVDYNAVGSGTGRAEFLSEAVDFAGSDAVMDDEEYEQSVGRCGPDGAFHIPTAIIPIAVAANLPGVEELNLSPQVIGEIFAGEIDTWNAPAIAEHNDGVDLPDTSITVIHRSDDSGTTSNFTDFLAATSDAWTWEADGEWPSEATAESADGTSGVVQATTVQEGGVTYADAANVPADLVIANVEVGGEYTELSPDAAGSAVAASDRVAGQAPNNMAFELTRDTEEIGAYPIVQVAYTIWCNEYGDAETADLARGFADYIVSAEAQSLAEAEAGASPLTDELRSEAQDAIAQISAG